MTDKDRLSEHPVQEASGAFVAPPSQVVHPGQAPNPRSYEREAQAIASKDTQPPSQPVGAGL